MRPLLKAGYYYHIYNRGNNGENIFKESTNYNFFLQRYSKYCYPVLDTYAYCQLKNHFHLLVRIRNPTEVERLIEDEKIDEKVHKRLSKKGWSPQLVSQQLGHLFNSYTQAFNKKYDRSGSLFERPFKRRKIDQRKYFCNLVSYIHRNPQLHKLCDDFKSYQYSSYPIFSSKRESKINRQETRDRFGGIENFKTAHEQGMEISKEIHIE